MLESIEPTRWTHWRGDDASPIPLMSMTALTVPVITKESQLGLELSRLHRIEGRPNEPILEIQVLDKRDDNIVRNNEVHGFRGPPKAQRFTNCSNQFLGPSTNGV